MPCTYDSFHEQGAQIQIQLYDGPHHEGPITGPLILRNPHIRECRLFSASPRSQEPSLRFSVGVEHIYLPTKGHALRVWVWRKHRKKDHGSHPCGNMGLGLNDCSQNGEISNLAQKPVL